MEFRRHEIGLRTRNVASRRSVPAVQNAAPDSSQKRRPLRYERPPEFEGYISSGSLMFTRFASRLQTFDLPRFSDRPRYRTRRVGGSRWARLDVPRAAIDPSPAAFAEGAATC